MQHHDNNYNVTENTTDSSEDKEQAIITLKYAGLESIPERDVITFFQSRNSRNFRNCSN